MSYHFRSYLLLLLLPWSIMIDRPCRAQIPVQVVPLVAEVTASPATISISWPFDPSAPYFQVYRRSPGEEPWEQIAVLPGMSTGYTDTDVQPGQALEYKVVRSARLPTMDTLCVPPGTTITFNIFDTGGNGLCCWTSDGYWQLFACGAPIAMGSRYEFMDQFQFTMCGTAACEELVVVIYPDHQFQEVSWQMLDDMGNELAAGAPDMAPMFGYLMAGIDVPAVEQQGTLLLLVADEVADDLTAELDRLELDLLGEGWLVQREIIQAGTPVHAVKDLILSTANSHPDLEALLLIGHVPVPYAGLIAPDEHEDHVGAWPADLYYAELDGPWTDGLLDWQPWFVPERNHNAPNDGRFDQSSLPSDVDLIMGRIDFSDLPVFDANEIELLRSYLDRDHAFRTGELIFDRKAVIQENFPGLDHESAVYRSAIPMFGQPNVIEAPFLSTLAMEKPLWSMAGGPGAFTAAAGVATSAEVAATGLNGAYVHVLGSYFGDWDVTDNFMRSIVAGGMLGAVWGLQELQFHHMALGGSIGNSVRSSQNAHYKEYERHGRLVHMALMGDPTLKLLPVPQVDQLDVQISGDAVLLQWTPVQAEDLIGYHIYRRNDPTQHFTRLNDQPITGNSFTDTAPVTGHVQYSVRALRKERTESGTYFELGTGRIAALDIVLGTPEFFDHDMIVQPNPNTGEFSITGIGDAFDTEVELFDLSGAAVPVRIERSTDRIRVSTSAAEGMYVLRFRDRNGEWTHRSLAILH